MNLQAQNSSKQPFFTVFIILRPLQVHEKVNFGQIQCSLMCILVIGTEHIYIGTYRSSGGVLQAQNISKLCFFTVFVILRPLQAHEKLNFGQIQCSLMCILVIGMEHIYIGTYRSSGGVLQTQDSIFSPFSSYCVPYKLMRS